MVLPKGSEYFEAIQHPLRCFRDDTLRRGQAALDPQGKPLVRHGWHADVYEIRCAAARERWAIKCFTRELVGLARRYQALNEQLLGLDCPALAQAEFLEQGICLRGRWFPTIKMRWIEGQRLNDYVREVCDQPQILLHVADLWLGLSWQLRRVGVAHGNLQHDHVLVGRGATGTIALRLIDYDGVFVPALATEATDKLGHANFQHPQRLWQKICDAAADRFPELVIYTALRALAVRGPALWERFDHGDNLLFREQDFLEPASSALFQVLWQVHDPIVHALTGRLLLACQGPAADVPLLEEVGQGKPLTEAEEEQIHAVLGAHAGACAESFALALEQTGAPPDCTVEIPRTEVDAGNFDLEVEDEPATVVSTQPAAHPLPCPPEQLATAIYDRAAYLPDASLVLAEPLPVVELVDGPEVAIYHLDAWMPEQIAVMKLQGFVRAEEAEVVESVPGLVRVHLLDRYSVTPETPAPGLLTWLGLAQPPPPRPKHLATLELHLKNKETEFKRLLDITVRIRPGPDAEPDDPRWRVYCDRLFCTLRSFLMGNV